MAADATDRAIAGSSTVGQPVTLRTLSLPRVPAHVGTMLGMSVAGYGVTLALVTALQATSEAALITDRAPMAATIDQLVAGDDRLERDLDRTNTGYDQAAAGYRSLVDSVSAAERTLGNLASSVARLDGAARALPATVAMPAVVQSVGSVSKPKAHATSGGSAAP